MPYDNMYTVVTFIVIVKISSLVNSDQSPVIFISSHDLVLKIIRAW